MKVFLLTDVKGLGRRFDVRSVAEGYARNFLIPRGLARVADNEALRLKAEHDAAEQTRAASYERAAREFSGMEPVAFVLRSGPGGGVYGSVTAAMIEDALRGRGIAHARVELAKPIREAGMHEVPVHFGHGIRAAAKISVTFGSPQT